MNTIPIDLIDEIFSRLPAKSIGRCRCVSELWRSILCRPNFTKLFLTRSSASPRLLFAMQGFRSNEWLFFSSLPPHSPYEKLSSLVVAADFHLEFCGGASGLFCFRDKSFSKGFCKDAVHVICNPSIGKYGLLPKLRSYIHSQSFLGFDPIDKIYKVLSIATSPSGGDGPYILTLGTGEMRWRKIQCPLTHHPYSQKGIYINGFLYYLALESAEPVMVCFDVRSEKFKFIHAGFINEDTPPLINYKGKLGVTNYDELCVWVLEDIEKQEWSKYSYTLPDNQFDMRRVLVVGVTATGEIVLSDLYPYRSCYVFFFNPESNTLHRVIIQSSFQVTEVYTFVDYAEDLTFNMKAHQKRNLVRFESINKFDALNLLDDV